MGSKKLYQLPDLYQRKNASGSFSSEMPQPIVTLQEIVSAGIAFNVSLQFLANANSDTFMGNVASTGDVGVFRVIDRTVRRDIIVPGFVCVIACNRSSAGLDALSASDEDAIGRWFQIDTEEAFRLRDGGWKDMGYPVNTAFAMIEPSPDRLRTMGFFVESELIEGLFGDYWLHTFQQP